MDTRNLIFSEGSSNKFWNIALNGSEHTVTWGRVGTAGQTQTKTFASETEAKSSYSKLVAEKLKKGYTDATGAAPTTSPPTAKAPVAKPAALPLAAAEAKVPEPEAESPSSNPVSPPDHAVSPQIENRKSKIENPGPRFNLDARALLRATWRPRPAPRPKPAIQPFDKAAACARLSAIGERGYSEWWWSKAHIPLAMSKEEAHFWFAAMFPTVPCGSPTRRDRYKTPKEAAEHLAHGSFTGDVTLEAAVVAINRYGYSWSTPPEVVLPLVNLYGIVEMLDIVQQTSTKTSVTSKVLDAFCTLLLPSLTEADAEAIRGYLRAEFPALPKQPMEWQLQIAALVGGMEDDLRTYVSKWPDDHGSPYPWRGENTFLQIVLGLGDPDLIASELHRLKLAPTNGEEVQGVLAATEARALDLIRDGAQLTTDKASAESIVKAFTRAEVPEAAPFMLDLLLDSRAPRPAREWLDNHPEHAITGLVPIAGEEQGKRAEAAIDLLRMYKQRGFEAALRARLENVSPQAARKIREHVLEFEVETYASLDEAIAPDWLTTALAASSARPLPGDIARASELPPLPARTAGESKPRRLSDIQAGTLLAALRKSTWDQVDPLITAVRDNVDRRALDTFAWKLFENWLADGAPSKAKWEMTATGFLGNDASALKLAPMIRTWPGESQHNRAVLGLECLRAIGTDTALMQINGIAQRVAFKGLKARAAECMEDIARDRGLTRAELEDRIVPDCELDERGTRVFDFGPRKFTFVLGQDMKPMIRDEAKVRRPDLPKPNSKDDSERAEAAIAEWKLLKKQISEVTKIQIARLEQAMVTGRTWRPADFDLLLVRHPLMTNLVRLFIWGAYDVSGRPLGTFRVTEDQTLADENDETFGLPEGTAQIGLMHTLHLSEALRYSWGEILSDYEIIAPFPQIGRPVFTLEENERQESQITRFAGKEIPPQTLVFTLEKLGWTRGIPMDAGIFSEHVKVFPAADVTAVVTYDGVPVGGMDDWDDQEIKSCFFLKGIRHQTGWMSWDAKTALSLDQVDPVVISEVLRDLTMIAAKVKSE